MYRLKKLYSRIKNWMDYNPPGSLSMTGWRLFNEEFKERAPVRYWLTHNFRHSTILPIKRKLVSMNRWVGYRTYDRYHVLKTGLPPGYYSVSTQMLNVNFNLLKDFVEVETAWHQYSWSEEIKRASWAERYLPFYYFFMGFRRPDMGIKHLAWASTLDDPALPPHERCDHQARAARETLELYNWWTVTRPNRKDIQIPLYSDQGLGAMSSLDKAFNKNATDYKAHKKAMARQVKQEEDWVKEDNKMLMRLMKIRDTLWT